MTTSKTFVKPESIVHIYELEKPGMSRKVPSCVLEAVTLSEAFYSEICTFLETLQLTASEAQIVWEVAFCRQHHISLMDLSRRMPKEFKRVNIESLVKNLVQEGSLQFYEAKKDELCVRCTSLGWDIAHLINAQCYSGKLKYFDMLREKYAEQDYLLCFDPQGFKVGQKRCARGPKGEKADIVIDEKSRSDNIFRKTTEGIPVYEIRLTARISGCPQCNTEIPIDFCFSPVSCYRDFVQVHCKKCGFTFKLRHALDKFYY